jgi:SPP1 family predicted phage head-tail adaptor
MATFASTLQHWVTIQAPGPTRDAAGQPLPSGFVTHRQDWADIRHTGGLEAIRAGAVTSKVNASIRMRHCTDLNSSMRIVYGSTTYEIKAVLPDANRIYVDLVVEVVA